jgi:hypothetical protein
MTEGLLKFIAILFPSRHNNFASAEFARKRGVQVHVSVMPSPWNSF